MGVTGVITMNPEQEILVVNKYTDGDITNLFAQGEIDPHSVPHLTQELKNSLDASEQVTLDLNAVDFFGAAGVHGLIEAATYAAQQNKALRITNPSEIVRKIIQLTGAESLLPLEAEDTLE